MTLERIDNNGNYEPGNCRWATQREQTRNMRNNRLISFGGETLCMTDWASRIGITVAALWLRLDRGWPLERALGPGLHQVLGPTPAQDEEVYVPGPGKESARG